MFSNLDLELGLGYPLNRFPLVQVPKIIMIKRHFFQTIFQAKQTEFYSGLDGKKDAVFEKDGRDAIWLEKDVMVPLAGTNTSYVYLVRINWLDWPVIYLELPRQGRGEHFV